MRAEALPRACTPEAALLVERMRAGEIRALARAASLVEDGALEAAAVLSCCFPYTGAAMRIGITGPPGAGKSTLADQLTRQYREQGLRVGAVAVDPTSPFTGGAILGDRIRIQGRHGDDGFYLRSMATRGSLGGLARTTADVASVIEASGRERILVETVGVGQDEVDIVRLADITVVVLVPGMGDDVQSIKAGIMEIADIFVVNKSDREGADRVEKEIRGLQSLDVRHGARHAGWVPPVVRTVATTGAGAEELAAAIGRFWQWLAADGRLEARREACWRERILEMIRYELLREVRHHGLDDGALAGLAREAAAKTINPYQQIPALVERLLERKSHS